MVFVAALQGTNVLDPGSETVVLSTDIAERTLDIVVQAASLHSVLVRLWLPPASLALGLLLPNIPHQLLEAPRRAQARVAAPAKLQLRRIRPPCTLRPLGLSGRITQETQRLQCPARWYRQVLLGPLQADHLRLARME